MAHQDTPPTSMVTGHNGTRLTAPSTERAGRPLAVRSWWVTSSGARARNDRGIDAYVVFDGENIAKARLEGRPCCGRQLKVHISHRRQPGAKAPVPAPAGRGTPSQARFVPPPPPAPVKGEHGDTFCRKRNGRLPRLSPVIPIRHIVDYPRQSGDFRSFIVIVPG